MKTTTILFDLDGTLLPMNQDDFVNTYFSLLAKKLVPFGYKPDELISAIWAGTKQMVLNNGEKTNEEVFWEAFSKIYGDKARNDEPIFDEYYRNEFSNVKNVCGYNEKASRVVSELKNKGFRLVLSTNPIFPAVATESRISWAGLDKKDFELYTTYENSNYSKPNLEYYLNICEKIGVSPNECLVVGNDVSEDMVAEKIGMKVFLLTDCLINKENKDISNYPNGNFDDLLEFVKSF